MHCKHVLSFKFFMAQMIFLICTAGCCMHASCCNFGLEDFNEIIDHCTTPTDASFYSPSFPVSLADCASLESKSHKHFFSQVGSMTFAILPEREKGLWSQKGSIHM